MRHLFRKTLPRGHIGCAPGLRLVLMLVILRTPAHAEPASNDTCGTAQPITESATFGATVDATTSDPSICGDASESPDVWYSFTNLRDCAIEVTASTCDATTTFDTLLAVYASCGGLQATCNDDDPGCDLGNGRQSTVSWIVPSGATHFIRVSGYAGETGDFKLSLTTPQANSFCRDATPILDGSLTDSTLCNFRNGNSFCDGASVREPLPPPITASASSEFSGKYVVTNLFDGSVDIEDLDVTSYGTTDGQFAALGVVDGAEAEVFLDFGDSVSTVGVAYSQRVGGDPLLDKVGEIKLWFSDVDFASQLPQTSPDADVFLANTTNAVLTSYLFGGTRTGRYVALQLISATPQDPGNLGGSELRLLTLPPRSPSAWFAYTNPYSIPVYMSATTCSPYTNFDTTLSVLDTCAGLEIGCNDDAICPANAHASTLERILVAGGRTYNLRVSGVHGEAGDFDLQVSSVARNNDCATPVSIVDDEPLDFHTFGTSTDGPIATQSCVDNTDASVRADIWFTYTGSCDGNALALLCESSFDTVVAVFDGMSCPTAKASSVSCNDDACGIEGYASAISFPTTTGATSLIQVGGWQGAQGEGRIEVLCFEPGDFDRDQVVSQADHSHFVDCMSGPDNAPHPAIAGILQARCLAAFDTDADGDVDVADAAHIFQEFGD